MRKVEKFWNGFLTLTAFFFLISYSYPAFQPNISQASQDVIGIIQSISWLSLALDLIYGVLKAESKAAYFKKNLLEVFSVILPFLRPLRLLRLISLGGFLIQKVAIGRQIAITTKVALSIVFVSYIAAVQITLSERNVPGSNIKSFSDGLWWAVTTVTTVGYGDRYPTTIEGRFLAVLLMILGISLVGVLTASIAVWFVKMGQEEIED